MQGIEEVGNEDNNLETTASINNTSFSTGVQTQSIPFDNNYSLVATLTPASSALKAVLRHLLTLAPAFQLL